MLTIKRWTSNITQICWKIQVLECVKSLQEEQQKFAQSLHKEQLLLAQRQLVIPLWKYLVHLKRIDLDDPDPKDVLAAANALELIALCCEGEIVDKKLVLIAIHFDFAKNEFDYIKGCTRLIYSVHLVNWYKYLSKSILRPIQCYRCVTVYSRS